MQAFNIHPDHMSIKELATWGEEHSEPWVRRLVYYAEMLTYLVPSEYRNDPDEWFEENEIKLRDLESSNSWAEEAQHDAEFRAGRAEDELAALRLDNDKAEMYYQNNALKARLREEQLKNERLRSEMAKDAEAFIELEKDHKYLKEVHNTWSIISKPVIEDDRIPF